VILRSADNKELRIYTTPILTEMRLVTLMHDPQYQLAVAWQNVGYNQPLHPGFFLGDGMKAPQRPHHHNTDQAVTEDTNMQSILTIAASLFAGAIISLALPAADEPAPRILTLFIVGDSTVKNGTKGQQGWGDPVAALFDKTKIKVQNHAIGGRSSRTFQTEGRWDKILSAAKPGDFVLVQMGHNDGGPLDDAARARGSIRGTGEETKEIDNPIGKKKEVVHTYGWYMRKYVNDAREKKMIPIIVSPIPHCPQKQVAKGEVEKSNYAIWSEEVAKAEKADFVNLNKIVMSKYAELTPADIKTKYFTAADNTHTSPTGAELNAACVAEGLRELKDCKLKDYLIAEKR
jgi:rhamnogalacturonan acetylesterase